VVVVLDGTQLPRTSKRLPGVGFLRAPRTPVWRPGIHYAQRWEGLSGLTPVSTDGDARAVPLWFEPAPTPKATTWDGYPPRKEWEAGLAALGWLRAHLAECEASTRPIVAVADGAYTGAALWNGLPAHTTLLARCPKNRALFALPSVYRGRGRRRLYGEQGPAPQDQRADPEEWQQLRCQVRGTTHHLTVKVTGPWVVKKASAHPLMLIIVKGSQHIRGARIIRRDPTYYLVSAVKVTIGEGADQTQIWTLPWPLAELLSWAWQRWEVEVMHRELKSGWGLGDQQQTHPVSAALVPQWVVWAYAMLVLVACQAGVAGPAPPATKWYRGRRWTPRDVLAEVRQDLWQRSITDLLADDADPPATGPKMPVDTAPPLAWLRIAQAL